MTIKEALRTLTATGAEIYCKVCTVDAVDEAARTVDVTPLDESAPILGVNLQANQCGEAGLTAFPAVGSHVVTAFLNDAAAVVILTERVEKLCGVVGKEKPLELTVEDNRLDLKLDKTTLTVDGDQQIVFNGGKNGGLVQVQELTDKLNNLKDQVNAFIKVYNNHIHVTSATIGASSDPGIIEAPASKAEDADKFDRKDYENKDITH